MGLRILAFKVSEEKTQPIPTGALITDYPKTALDKGNYLFLITNDIRYLETNYSISLNVSVLDWRFVTEQVDESINFGLTTERVISTLDFGSIS